MEKVVYQKGEKMEEKKRERVNARMATLAVLEILQKKTDENHKLHIMDIVREAAKEPYELKLHRDTVKAILADLQEFYQMEDRVCCETTSRFSAEGEELDYYTYNYYWKREFSNEEIQLLIDDVMFSKMRSKKQVEELTKKIKSFATEEFAKKLNYLEQIPYKQYTVNELTQKNIAKIHQIIAKNSNASQKEVWLVFTFNGYGTDKKLHPVGTFQVFPMRICELNKNYYLICYLKGMKNLSHFRIDLMTNMQEISVTVEEDQNRLRLKNSLTTKSVSEYLTTHPFMFYEGKGDSVKNIILRVKKMPGKPEASMTLLYDMFGKNWEAIQETENDEYVDVKVRCLLSGIKVFVNQYQDRLQIISCENI